MGALRTITTVLAVLLPVGACRTANDGQALVAGDIQYVVTPFENALNGALNECISIVVKDLYRQVYETEPKMISTAFSHFSVGENNADSATADKVVHAEYLASGLRGSCQLILSVPEPTLSIEGGSPEGTDDGDIKRNGCPKLGEEYGIQWRMPDDWNGLPTFFAKAGRFESLQMAAGIMPYNPGSFSTANYQASRTLKMKLSGYPDGKTPPNQITLKVAEQAYVACLAAQAKRLKDGSPGK